MPGLEMSLEDWLHSPSSKPPPTTGTRSHTPPWELTQHPWSDHLVLPD